jgi:electron transfer flavoprotein beta subunit
VNTIVCIKRVPDTETRIRIGADGKSIDPSGVKFVLNPYDEFALEEAIRLKEEAGSGAVTVITVGDDSSKETLRTALAMGADQAVLLRATPDIDALPVARALSDAIRSREFDLVLFGKQAVDYDNMQVPPMVAELLELPSASVVVELRIDAGRVEAKREVEGGHEVIEFDLPAVISTQKGLNEPRYPSLKGIMAAKKKPMEEVDIELDEARVTVEELDLPPRRSGSGYRGDGPEAVPELVQKLHEEVKAI